MAWAAFSTKFFSRAEADTSSVEKGEHGGVACGQLRRVQIPPLIRSRAARSLHLTEMEVPGPMHQAPVFAGLGFRECVAPMWSDRHDVGCSVGQHAPGRPS